MPDMNKPLSKAALEKQYEELCSQITGYHVAGSLSTVRTPNFDNGSTNHLFSAECDPYMTNTSKSPLSIGGFSGPERISAGLQGTISAFMVSNNPGTTGSMVIMKVHSVATVNINAYLISGPCLSLDGYGIDLPPQGAELMGKDKSIDKTYVDGLYKLDKKGERTDQIPCHFEENRKRWTMTMVMSAGEKTAQRVGLALQVQRQTNTPAHMYLAEQKFLQNSVKSTQNQLESMQRDSRSVSGVNTYFHSVTHVQNTLHDVGTQLWGNRVPVNKFFFF
jgi:hypothetical protein